MSAQYNPRLLKLRYRSIAFTVAAVSSVLAAARKQRLPPLVGKVRDRLTERHAQLQAAHAARVTRGATDDSRGRADEAEDRAWRGLYHWLRSFLLLPAGSPQSVRARHLLDLLFSDGLRFIQLEYKAEWAEAEARLRKIEAEKLEPEVVALGGEPFLAALRVAHKAYGQALGTTQVMVAAPRQNLKALRAEVMADLRDYVVKIAGQVDPDQPATGDLAAQLLQPLADWSGRVKTRPSVGPELAVTAAVAP